MSDNPNEQENPIVDVPPDPPPAAEPKTPDSGGDDHMIPKAVLDKEKTKRRELEAKLKAIEEEEKDRKQKEALERGEHVEIIAELQPKAEKAERYEKQVQERVATKIESLPEDLRTLVPNFPDPMDTWDWLQTAEAAGVFTPPKPPNTDAGAQGDKPEVFELTDGERGIARQLGLSDEEYARGKDTNTFDD